MQTLPYELNPFGGAVVAAAGLPDNTDEFILKLDETIKDLNNQKIKVLWMTLPLEKSEFVPIAAARGFIYHHAEPDYLHMTCTLIDGSYIPPYATHYIGAGGVVLDDQNRLLVISEKYYITETRRFKLPGGALNSGEHISEAVVREVLEETGIQTEFQYISCFRHWHGYRYEKSDIYYVCRLKPLSFDITMDTEEIHEALWMPVEDFLNHENISPFNKRIVRSTLAGNGLVREEVEGYGSLETHEMMFGG